MARVTMLILLMLVAALPAAAQAPAERPIMETKPVDPIVVTGTLVETPASQTGASVTVITGEEVNTYHYPTLDEALRNVPGVEIRRSGSFGKTTSVSIRGANPNQVQVLVDGVRFKSPTLGQSDLADLNPELIDRIEVIRGPQSTIYGADAIGGVVHIITKRGSGPPTAAISQEVGNYATLRSRASLSGSTGPFDYALGFLHLESNGQYPNDGLNQNGASGNFGFSLPGNTRIGAAIRYNKNDVGLPIEFVGTPNPVVPETFDPNTRQESETYTVTADVRTRPVTWWEGVLRYSRYANNQAFIDPADPFACPPATFGPPCDFPGRFKVSRNEVEGQSHFHIGTWSTSTFGVEWREEVGNVQGFNAFSPYTRTWSGYFEQKFRFFDRLFMSAGVRVEDNNVFGRQTTERGSLAYVMKEWGTRLHGGAGSGFRAPTFNELFFPGFSNPSLVPEESFSWDVGVGQNLWDNRIRLDLTYFHNKFTDLITCCLPLPVFPFATTANIGKARSAGIEFTSEVDLLDTLTLGVNYTYTDTENLLTDRPLPREPRHRWNIRLTWTPIPRLQLFSEVHTVSRQFDTLGDVYNSGHTRVDVGGTFRILNRYAFIKALDFTARIQNLLDEGYAEVRGFPALGINALAGLRASF
jgi:vitamin B12 transporter